MHGIKDLYSRVYGADKRRAEREHKERQLRRAVERQFTHSDLLGIFGAAIRARLLEEPYRPGKHSSRGRPHPAGTKLVRRFIRQSGRESTYWRKAYRALAGHQYGEVPQ